MEPAVISSNKFNLKLLLQSRGVQPQGNIFYSPISIVSALAMLYSAAKANTKKEMEDVLDIEDQNTIHEGFKALFKSIRKLSSGNSILNIVNMLAVDKNYKILPQFSNNSKENYDAESKLLDFQHHAENARKELNQFIELATQEKIKDLFTPDSITSLTRLVLANAVYFKGMWNEQFDRKDTKRKPFYTNRNEEITVDMMFREGDYAYLESSDLNARFLEIPYLGSTLGMIILLPDERNGLAFVETNLTLEKLNECFQKMNIVEEIQLSLPRFKLEESIPLKERLIDLGMKEVFTPNADISGISGIRDLYVSAASHKAFVEVNEEGTEAAAATEMKIVLCCYREPCRFTVDHPFIFFIRERDTGLILFTGSVHTL